SIFLFLTLALLVFANFLILAVTLDDHRLAFQPEAQFSETAFYFCLPNQPARYFLLVLTERISELRNWRIPKVPK
ncbi:MAG: hypothetical protein AAFN93_28175, partial [Bacteroidota bacterium]